MKPYCFVKEKEAWKARGTKIEGGYTGLYGEKLSRIEFESEAYLRQAREDMDTWEANIRGKRVSSLILGGNVEYEERVWFLDMEWKMDSGEITIVVVRDSLDGEFVWFTHPDVGRGNIRPPCRTIPTDRRRSSLATDSMHGE